MSLSLSEELLQLQPKLQELIELFLLPKNHPDSCYVIIPTDSDSDLSVSELAHIVAQTSNNYARASRLSGAAKALEKRAEGAFKMKYKAALAHPAKNADARESYAYDYAAEEYQAYIEASSISELAASMEAAARIASESARKLIDKAHNANIGDNRSATYASY